MHNLIKVSLLSFLCLIFTTSYAIASSQEVAEYVPHAELVGEGRLTYLLWDVYDAALYAPYGKWKKDQTFALKLSYLRPISGKEIADRSVKEIREQGINDEVKLAIWHRQMVEVFPDVDEGISLTGVRTNNGATVFYKNAEKIGTIDDQVFTEHFFNIWLGKKTNVPDLKKKLLGKL